MLQVKLSPKKEKHKTLTSRATKKAPKLTEWKCLRCNQLVHFKKHWKKHQKEANCHELISDVKSKSWICNICLEIFFTNDLLQSHKQIHKENFTIDLGANDFYDVNPLNDKKPFTCIVCLKAYSSETFLLNHQTKWHYVGLFEGKTPAKTHILNRIKKKRVKPKVHLCNFCGHCFRENCKLIEHVRIHTGENPYVCSECGKSFKKKESLRIHTRVHTGEKPYSCEFCGKRFGQNAPFKVHLRTHTGERPYVCLFCRKGFTTNQGLKLHKKNCKETSVPQYINIDSSEVL